MARRRQKHLIDPKVAFGLLIALVVIWVVVQLLQQPGTGVVILLGGAGALAYLVVRFLRHDSAHRTLLQKVEATIEQQKSSLVRRKAQLVWRDAYGKLVLDKWSAEIDYFITHHICPSLTIKEQSILEKERVEIARMISEHIETVAQNTPVSRAFSDAITPREFEVFCAEQLRQSGWNAQVTQQSRDQGVDVIAEKDGLRIVLQCKLYSGPVGNKAVQEAVAARAYEQAHHCAVVTNSRYTSAAEQLASTNGVLLLHHSDLPRLETLLPTAVSTTTVGSES